MHKREDAGSPLSRCPARIMKKLILKYEILNVNVLTVVFLFDNISIRYTCEEKMLNK